MVGEMIVRIVSTLLQTTVSWKTLKKNCRVDNASVSDICRYGIVSCGGCFDCSGGEFVKNHRGYHVTIIRVLLQ